GRFPARHASCVRRADSIGLHGHCHSPGHARVAPAAAVLAQGRRLHSIQRMNMQANPSSSNDAWPVSQVCFTRPTADLSRLLRFYRDGLGLQVLYQFGEADDPAGAMLGLPGAAYHLELIKVPDHTSGPPSKHNVMVLHIPDRAHRDAMAEGLRAL